MKAKNKSKKRKIAVITSLLALIAMIAGTFAWSSYTEWVKNHMQSRGYEEGRVTIVEDFDGEKKPIDENPTIKKDVKVVNTSSADAFVRVSFEEMLQKLQAEAKTQAYPSLDLAKFPVIFNAAEYRDTYDDTTGSLRIISPDGTTQNAAEADGNLKLFVSKDEKNAVLLNLVSMTQTDWPKDFNVNQKDAVVPLYSGAWGTDAIVAQKVTGAVTKQTDGTWAVYTGKYSGSDADKNIGYWGYGKTLGDLMENNWAGFNQNLTNNAANTKPADADFGKSSLAGSGITFTQSNITVTKPVEGATPADDWYYNSADGYFYYTKVLKAGSTTDTSVIKEINFDLATDDSFKVASYNLFVGLEAIPAAQSAIVAESKFGELSASATIEGDKSWERGGSGWGLTDDVLIKYYNSIATIVE